jgi:hypothetical protein
VRAPLNVRKGAARFTGLVLAITLPFGSHRGAEAEELGKPLKILGFEDDFYCAGRALIRPHAVAYGCQSHMAYGYNIGLRSAPVASRRRDASLRPMGTPVFLRTILRL